MSLTAKLRLALTLLLTTCPLALISGIQRPLKAIQEKSQSIYIPRAS